VLVVDDDPDVRTTMVSALDALGYAVDEAEDGPSALEKLRVRSPALAVMDFAMPGMNGAELAVEARRLHPDLPILFVSGFADTEELERSVGKEMPLLRKPFKMSELAAAVNAALSKPA
jgi:CheY-like chemotaxis protein